MPQTPTPVPGRLRSPLIRVFARNLYAARKQAGLSQEALAAEAGLHRTYVGSVERAERNISLLNVERLARVVGVEAWTLLRAPTRPV